MPFYTQKIRLSSFGDSVTRNGKCGKIVMLTAKVNDGGGKQEGEDGEHQGHHLPAAQQPAQPTLLLLPAQPQ